MNTVKAKPIETILDLRNGPLYDLSWRLNYADTLLCVLQEKFFGHSYEAMEQNKTLQACFISDYKMMEAVLWAARDHTWETLKLMESIDSVDIMTLPAKKGETPLDVTLADIQKPTLVSENAPNLQESERANVISQILQEAKELTDNELEQYLCHLREKKGASK